MHLLFEVKTDISGWNFEKLKTEINSEIEMTTENIAKIENKKSIKSSSRDLIIGCDRITKILEFLEDKVVNIQQTEILLDSKINLTRAIQSATKTIDEPEEIKTVIKTLENLLPTVTSAEETETTVSSSSDV